MENKILSPLGEELQDEFEAKHGDGCCSCHIDPPCGYCTHPGNPRSLEGTPEAWRNEMHQYDVGDMAISKRNLKSCVSSESFPETKSIESIVVDKDNVQYKIDGSYIKEEDVVLKADVKKKAMAYAIVFLAKVADWS